MGQEPYCFVLMPMGLKARPGDGPLIDFNRIYGSALKPAIEEAGLQPLRDDDLKVGGVHQKLVFEALLICDYVVVDLTTGNPNVLYELGIRHAARASSTVAVTAHPDEMPFAVRDLRCVRYRLTKSNGLTAPAAAELRRDLAGELQQLRRESNTFAPSVDSPLFQLVAAWRPQASPRFATDLSRPRRLRGEAIADELAELRLAGSRETRARRRALARAHALRRDVDAAEPDAVADLIATFRALDAGGAIVELAGALPAQVREWPPIARDIAHALLRRARRTGDADRRRALRLLHRSLERHGVSARTRELVARVHAERWATLGGTDPPAATWHLANAVRAALRGFDADPLDPGPGSVAALLTYLLGDPAAESERRRLEPVVRFAAERLLGRDDPPYRAHAALLVLAVLRDDSADAELRAGAARTAAADCWEASTTADDLRAIARAPARRSGELRWVEEIAAGLASPDRHSRFD